MTSTEEDRGRESVSRVFDRLLEQAERLATAHTRPAASPDESAPTTGVHQIRAAAAAAIDGYADMFQRTFELYADLMENSLRRYAPPASAGGSAVELVGTPGSTTETTVWAHNSTDEAADVTLMLTELTAHDGTVIGAATGTFAPGHLTVAQGRSASAWLSVAIPADAADGIYYGYVLATGLPQANAPIRLVVGG